MRVFRSFFCAALPAIVLILPACRKPVETGRVGELEETISELRGELARSRRNADEDSKEFQAGTEKMRKEFDEEKAALEGRIDELRKRGPGEPSVARTASPSAPVSGTAKAAPGPKPRGASPAVVLIEGDKGRGSGFLVNHGGAVYLYTAAHVLSGNTKFTVTNSAGETFTSFGNLEVAEGADLVRLPLNEGNPAVALVLGPAGSAGNVTDILALGDGGGVGVVTETKGTVLGVGAGSVEVSAGVIQGSSGGPVVAADSGRVIGLVTHATTGRSDIWGQGTRLGGVRRFACRLDREWEWKQVSLSTFISTEKSIAIYDRLTRVGFAVAALSPTTEGLRLDTELAANTSVLSVLKPAKELPVVAAIIEMNSQLVARNLRVSESDLRKKFAVILQTVHTTVNQGSAGFHPDMSDPYHRERVKESIEWRKKANGLLTARINSLQ